MYLTLAFILYSLLTIAATLSEDYSEKRERNYGVWSSLLTAFP